MKKKRTVARDNVREKSPKTVLIGIEVTDPTTALQNQVAALQTRVGELHKRVDKRRKK
jgi:hypothetical protein